MAPRRYGRRSRAPHPQGMIRAVSDDDTRTDDQREWADWSAQGYRKFNQPRSVLRIESVAVVLVIGVLLALIWLAGR